jgi:hypothetical protein
MFGNGTAPGTDRKGCDEARIAAKQQAIRDISEWLEKLPAPPEDAFSTVVLIFTFEPCAEGMNRSGAYTRALCHWQAEVTETAVPLAPPENKTSAFRPSSRFTLLPDQYYESSGSVRGESTLGQKQASADAQRKARREAEDSAAKAGLCDQEGHAMRVSVSFTPPQPALTGGGRYTAGAFEAVCDWELIVECVSPELLNLAAPALPTSVPLEP